MFESAGTIIVIWNYISEPIIVLGISYRGAELPYGTRYKKDIYPHITARRETLEETSNLFYFSKKLYNNPIIDENKKYAYVINVYVPDDFDLKKVFRSNQNIIKKSNKSCWLEFSDITFIKISDAIKNNIMISPINKNFIMKDIFNNDINIFKREVFFIQEMIRLNLHYKSYIYRPLLVQMQNNTFLHNTYRLLY
jgi:hypothetical protein